MKKNCIEAQNIRVQFPVKGSLFQKKQFLKAVDGVSFSIEAGTTMGLVGDSGCGKTTVLRDLARQLSEARRRVAVVDERGEFAGMWEGDPQNDRRGA